MKYYLWKATYWIKWFCFAFMIGIGLMLGTRVVEWQYPAPIKKVLITVCDVKENGSVKVCRDE